MGSKRDAGEPTLAEAWAMLGERLGLEVAARGEHAITAGGIVRGRPVSVEIERKGARSEGWRFLAGLSTISSRNRRDTWHTVLSVGCTNPSGITGTIESVVDVDDPAWNPREYDPRNGRHVRSDPPGLAHLLDAEAHERLMSIMEDVVIQVGAATLVIDHRSTTRPDSGAGYVAGSFVHHYQGPPPPWPERAVAGPPWWIELLCDLADAVDAATSS
jgi:hypothetical protein